MCKSITVIGRRWFDRTYGNTYFSVRCYADGELVAEQPYEYGYGDQWEQRACELLAETGHINPERYPHGGIERLRMVCERQGINLVRDVSDVSRKRDL